MSYELPAACAEAFAGDIGEQSVSVHTSEPSATIDPLHCPPLFREPIDIPKMKFLTLPLRHWSVAATAAVMLQNAGELLHINWRWR